MTIPTDPFPNFINGVTVADGDQVDSRFKTLYDMFDPAQTGVQADNLKDSAVTTAKLAAAAVTAAKIEAQQAWQTIALLPAGWSGFLNYFKDSLGMVHLRGDALTTPGSSIAAATTLCTLPAGYRPGTTQSFGLLRTDSATAFVPVSITTAGVLAVGYTGLFASAAYSFGMISFRAEN